ncbi:MAG TPA: ribulose bisphosphate carboxylase small subunit [Actinomycetes bacterium]
MRLTQGSFSYLPDLTDDEITMQVQYALDRGWPVSVEYTDDPHPRNTYWELWGLPMFDLVDPAGVMREISDCRATFPQHYVRVLAFDASLGRQTTAMMFLVQRPAVEPGFRLTRSEGADRQQTYSVTAYSSDRPAGQRYQPS